MNRTTWARRGVASLCGSVVAAGVLAVTAHTAMASTGPSHAIAEPEATSVAMLIRADLAAPTGPSSQAVMPGAQSCGDQQCIDNFISDCKDAGGEPHTEGPTDPDGSGVICKPISSPEPFLSRA